MKTAFLTLNWGLTLLITGLLSLPTPLWALHVVVDPGHGGKDDGTTRGPVREAELTLQVAKILAQKIRKDPQMTVTLTRQSDQEVSLAQRVQLAEQVGGDLFLSIHINSSPDARAQGVEFFFKNQLPPDEHALYMAARENQGVDPTQGSKQSKTLHRELTPEVQLIVEDLVEHQRIRLSSELSKRLDQHWAGNRKSRIHTIQQAPFYVVSQTPMPATLVELGFLSNSKEAQELKDPSNQHRLAQSLYMGLRDFKEVMDNEPGDRLEY